jgi:hypothetical protein
MYQVQAFASTPAAEHITYHENQTVESTLELIESWRKQAQGRK